jgi:hypothetical protein
MGVERKEIVSALNTSIKELQQGIDAHCCLVASLMDGDVDERNLRPMLDLCAGRNREARLSAAIKEAIDVIEESRKAFKSKRLEALRKKLTQVLIETTS